MGFKMLHARPENGSILRESSVILGITQQLVADKAGIKPQHCQAFEGGQRNLLTASFKVACSVLEVLDLDIAEYYHNGYVIGEKIILGKDVRYKKTGKLVTEDVEQHITFSPFDEAEGQFNKDNARARAEAVAMTGITVITTAPAGFFYYPSNEHF